MIIITKYYYNTETPVELKNKITKNENIYSLAYIICKYWNPLEIIIVNLITMPNTKLCFITVFLIRSIFEIH